MFGESTGPVDTVPSDTPLGGNRKCTEHGIPAQRAGCPRFESFQILTSQILGDDICCTCDKHPISFGAFVNSFARGVGKAMSVYDGRGYKLAISVDVSFVEVRLLLWPHCFVRETFRVRLGVTSNLIQSNAN
jgi:hypothetical protein